MPTPQQLRDRLLKKLKELFQLDQPDLDFGFYRIMHAKSKQVEEFLDKDLLKIVADAFGQASVPRKAELQAAYEKAIQTAKEFGAANPEETEPVKKAKAALDALKDTVNSEGEVYDHLYRFFERYYEDGDFISRRYYTRENAGKAAPYAIPYNGEEVKLHWANADQYYIKTTEYFSNYTFDLTQSAEIRAMKPEERLLNSIPENPVYVHFHIVEATEGEHGNVRATEATKRYFIIHKEKPVEISDAGHLTINFEYRPDPEKTGQEGTWRSKRNNEAVETVLDFGLQIADLSEEELAAKFGLQSKINNQKSKISDSILDFGVQIVDLSEEELASKFGLQISNLKSKISNYFRLLKIPAPTESDRNRPLLAKYINQYTARNTMDYFIHKDLGGFLRRELDFYIKNEVMRLDDIENAEAPAVESYLAKIKVLRKIAGKLVDFLAQLEEFQKKLWLKKKFVVETNYCITLDRVPAELYPEIAANEAQHDEWVKLFVINDIEPDTTGNPGYAKPLAVDFLKANNKLVLDTKYFDDAFKALLIAAIESFDDQCDGLLIHSENFQALSLLQKSYLGNVKTIYIDPPYNTAASEIAYKNSYKHSSWLCMVNNGIQLAKPLLSSSNGVICCTIDDFEHKIFSQVIESNFGEITGTVAIRIKPSGRPIPNGFAISHEYAVFAKTNPTFPIARLEYNEEQRLRYRQIDEKGRYFWEMFRKAGSNSNRENRPTMFYPFYLKCSSGKLRIPKMEFDTITQRYSIKEDLAEGEIQIFPIKDDGTDGCWYFGLERAIEITDEFKAEIQETGLYRVYYRRRPNEGIQPTTLWFDSKYSATEHGTALLKAIFGEQETFSYPKSIHAVSDCLAVTGILNSPKGNVLDYFAGSGTTGHAVINHNREDDGKRKYILVEMGDYFDTVLKPRIAKVVYSANWKDGKPILVNNGQSTINNKKVGSLVTDHCSLFNGISHCFKYLRLESYEDTLNNLRFDENPVRDKALASKTELKEDYMLRYLLDVETRDSQSLLNIDAFADPTAYKLKVKKPGTDEYVVRNVDLIETFNYLIGLRVNHIAMPQEFTATFKRLEDPEVPKEQKTKLVVDAKIRQLTISNEQLTMKDGNCSLITDHCSWWFRKVEGWVPKDPQNPNNDQREKVLIVWRKLTGDLEKDNLMLDEWFQKNRISTRDFEFDTIYVNGSNNLPNLVQEGDTWKVRLIEEEFLKRMWEAEG